MTGRGDLDIIKGELQDKILSVCKALLPDGREEGGQWVSWNPVEADKGKTPALKVRLRGGVVGAWKCWRCGEAGDVIKLVAYAMRTDTAGALTWARDHLGLKKMTREDRERMRRVEATRKQEQEQADERKRAWKLAAAGQLFRAAGGDREVGPALVPGGTFAYHADPAFRHPAQTHAEAYFAARNVPLDEVPTLNPYSFAFSAGTEWWKGATYRTEGRRRFKTAPGPLYPAVHSAMRNRLGNITCCHVTFLDPIRPKKAPVEPAKLMYGEALGAVIEVSMGPAQKPFWHWQPGDKPFPVVLAEGIETATSFAVAGIAARVWACGSLAGVGAAPIDLPCVDWVLFARDNNAGNAQAQKQFDRALDQLEQRGKRVLVGASHVGDDFNDLATGEEE